MSRPPSQPTRVVRPVDRAYDPTMALQLQTGSYTAAIRRSGEWWIGWVEEVPGVNAQAHTREELMDNLRVALADIIDLNRADAVEAMGGEDYEEVSIAL